MQRALGSVSVLACLAALSCGDPLLPEAELIGEYDLISINGALPAAFPQMSQATEGHLHFKPNGEAAYGIGGTTGGSFAAVSHNGTWEPTRDGARFEGTGPIASFRYDNEKLFGDYLGHALVFQLKSRSILH